MSKYRVSIFGAGGMGIPTAFDQALFGETKWINIIEPNWDRLHHAMRRLPELLGEEHTNKISYFEHPSSLTWAGMDVAISCAPHVENVNLTQQALEYSVPFCDLGGHTATVEKQAQLAKDAKSAIVPDCGVSPGLANILAVHVAKQGCKNIRGRCGGNPYPRPDPSKNPLMYKILYSAEGTASGYTRWCTEIEGGQLVNVPALAHIHNFDDEFESAPTSHHSHFSVEHLHSLGVEQWDYQTLRYHGHYAALKKLGWEPNGDPHLLAEQLRHIPELAFNREKDVDRMTLVVGDVKGTPEYRYDVFSDPVFKFTAMELMTSWGISIVAHHMASGKGKPEGFAMPQQFVDTQWVINQLKKRIEHYEV